VTPNFRASGNGWSVAIPTAVLCAVISVLGQWLMRPTPDAHAASGADTAMREDIRELRQDVKLILSRLGGVEDAVKNDAVVRGARP
jgi:hypothetical protein